MGQDPGKQKYAKHVKNADKSAVRFSEDRRERPAPTYRIVLIDDGVYVHHGGDWAEMPKMVLEPRADLGVIWARQGGV